MDSHPFGVIVTDMPERECSRQREERISVTTTSFGILYILMLRFKKKKSPFIITWLRGVFSMVSSVFRQTDVRMGNVSIRKPPRCGLLRAPSLSAHTTDYRNVQNRRAVPLLRIKLAPKKNNLEKLFCSPRRNQDQMVADQSKYLNWISQIQHY